MTVRAYFDDVLLDVLDATVLAHGAHEGRPSVVLDATVFYAEAGGQMADRGTLAGAPLLDVQVDDAGVIHHVIEGSLPAIGARVRAELDRPRRRVHMALHSAQHMLSRALLDVCGAETVSSRLGEQACTIDVDRDALAAARIAECEGLVNDVIDQDRVVRAWCPSSEELASLPLRRAPKQSSNIRVVDVQGFDVSPCGGTHVTRTAQIGLLRVLGTERYKGGTRVTFSAGARARALLFDEDAMVRELARELASGPMELGAGLARVRAELTASREQLGRVRAQLARELAAQARQSVVGDRAVVVLAEGGVELARVVASELTQSGALVAIVAVRLDEGQHVLITRGPGASVDCAAWLRALTRVAGGRGGGRAERAEGRLPLEADIAASVALTRPV